MGGQGPVQMGSCGWGLVSGVRVGVVGKVGWGGMSVREGERG